MHNFKTRKASKLNLSRLVTKPTKWHVRPAKTQISLSIRPVWSEYSLSAWRKLWSLATHWAYSEDSDQTGRMPRLIWVFAGRTVILLVLSWGSFYKDVWKEVWKLFWLRFAGSITYSVNVHNWTASCQNQQNGMCVQRRLRIIMQSLLGKRSKSLHCFLSTRGSLQSAILFICQRPQRFLRKQILWNLLYVWTETEILFLCLRDIVSTWH